MPITLSKGEGYFCEVVIALSPPARHLAGAFGQGREAGLAPGRACGIAGGAPGQGRGVLRAGGRRGPPPGPALPEASYLGPYPPARGGCSYPETNPIKAAAPAAGVAPPARRAP